MSGEVGMWVVIVEEGWRSVGLIGSSSLDARVRGGQGADCGRIRGQQR